jgi:hypothetical protein
VNKVIVVVTLIFFLAGCSNSSFINRSDNIPDGDEKIIKEFRAHHDYSDAELKSLAITYLGEINGYRIYGVPYKGVELYDKDWIKDGYNFPSKSHSRIIGIISGHLYTLGNLIHETSIDIKGLYNLVPEDYKEKN